VSQLLVAQRALTVPGWVKDALWRRAQAVPSLDLRFADNKSLVDSVTGSSLVTFTRASSKTVTNSAGALETVGVDVPAFDHDPTTGESLGLLVEEQRTNLLLNSETLSTQSATVTAVAHTLHFTGTGTITLTGVSTAGPLVGTGTGEANRVSLTFTPTAGSLTLTVSGTVTNAQLEAGAFRTSYIATAGAATTRSADVASITGSAFSSWYRQDEGTMFAEAALAQPNSGGNQFVLRPSDNSFNNQVALNIQGSGFSSIVTAVGGVIDGTATSAGLLSANTAAKFAGAYAANNLGLSLNGGTVAVDTSATMPTALTRADIGSDHIGANRVKAGTIRRLTYWPQRLANSTLQSITQ
jgi:hypothetical protein